MQYSKALLDADTYVSIILISRNHLNIRYELLSLVHCYIVIIILINELTQYL